MFTDMLKDRFRAGLRKFGVYSLIRRARGEYLEHLEHDTNEARFSHIYEKGLWTLGNKDTPLSGTGSTLHATADLRALLPELLKKLEVKVLLDLGCGDYSWMKHVSLGGVKYIGADIVRSVIETNRIAHPDQEFIHANAISDPLPATDAVMIREMLFHLSYNDIYTALRNVLSTDCKWLLLTTDQVDTLNVDIKTGDFRILNLETKPFFFPKPKFVLQENSNRRDRILGVWNTDDLRSYLQ